ncbi:MAG: hypothetical protein ACKVP7_27410 [Hyphomicrobiaceae bacterium]
MSFFKDMFLGIVTDDMKVAQLACEKLLGVALKCTHSTFCGGIHCHASIRGSSFDLRLNHHDDGDGWSWCIDDPRYPLTLSCTFVNETLYLDVMEKLKGHAMIEVPAKYR